ncbi:MAG: hypothetical protein WAW75_04020 [Gallionella sp.]
MPFALNVIAPSALYHVPVSGFDGLLIATPDRSAAWLLPLKPVRQSITISNNWCNGEKDKDMVASLACVLALTLKVVVLFVNLIV